MVGLPVNRLRARLSRMSWDELSTRARQEASKRLDVAWSRVGLPAGRNGVRESAGPPGKFFFSIDEVVERSTLVQEHLPQEAGSIVEEANEICGHRFRLLGYRDLEYGAEIDWHLDAVHPTVAARALVQD